MASYRTLPDRIALGPSGYAITMKTSLGLVGAHDAWLSDKVSAWCFAILRFAVTLDQRDRRAAIAMAEDMDRRACEPWQRPFNFFLRTTSGVCDAVTNVNDPHRSAILQRYLKAVDHPRLREVMAAAFALDGGGASEQRRPGRTAAAPRLWHGLAP